MRPTLRSMPPGFDSLSTVFSFTVFQNGMVTTLGLHDLSPVWIFIDFAPSSLVGRFFRNLRSLTASACLRVEDADHIAEAVAVFTHQGTQLFFELHLRLDRIRQGETLLASYVVGGAKIHSVHAQLLFRTEDNSHLKQAIHLNEHQPGLGSSSDLTVNNVSERYLLIKCIADILARNTYQAFPATEGL